MKTIFISLFLLLAISTLIFFLWYRGSLKPISTSSQTSQTLVIPKGASAGRIAQLLKDQKLIRSPLAFRLYLRLHPGQDHLRAGSFKLSPNLSVSEIVTKLTRGGFRNR